MLPPAGPPYAAAPVPARPPRPSGWWFVAGGALLVAGVVAGVVLFVSTLSGFLSTDARVDATGTQEVTVPTDGERMLWVPEGTSVRCQVLDVATGEPVRTGAVTGDLRRSDSSGSWVGVLRFDPGSGTVSITCPGATGTLLIGPAPSVGGFVGGLLLTVLVPLLLGGAGLVVLVLTGVLWATRPPRARV
ncbi:hypothetical protein [Nocardioides sp. zg-DK7169]|uniref:hypothetical protein n=1 Tax=Nocardioides sp. zg-DK7169 TaxID=2736600 RepID=UPI001554C23D|nr:hypothetical protein [Nocardioides sp. zg-DK7169]NPC95555.1 hypothetical protein [Nocardioides sp. zg-DK7169]